MWPEALPGCMQKPLQNEARCRWPDGDDAQGQRAQRDRPTSGLPVTPGDEGAPGNPPMVDWRIGAGACPAKLDGARAIICAKPAPKPSIAWFKSDKLLAGCCIASLTFGAIVSKSDIKYRK